MWRQVDSKQPLAAGGSLPVRRWKRAARRSGGPAGEQRVVPTLAVAVTCHVAGCGRSFATLLALKKHVQRVHACDGRQLFPCPHGGCRLVCVDRSGYRAHLKTHLPSAAGATSRAAAVPLPKPPAAAAGDAAAASIAGGDQAGAGAGSTAEAEEKGAVESGER
eukprot:PLAT355.1.p1 GENE.PLAT355.1~~PLAT355.1.p1  ORF type:complete len:179 (+),score=62.27 PLAT355.1:51-539(+)